MIEALFVPLFGFFFAFVLSCRVPCPATTFWRPCRAVPCQFAFFGWPCRAVPCQSAFFGRPCRAVPCQSAIFFRNFKPCLRYPHHSGKLGGFGQNRQKRLKMSK